MNAPRQQQQPRHQHPKLFYHLPDGKVASVYRVFLFPKQDKRGAEEEEGVENENDSDANRKVVSNGLEKLRQAIKEVNQTLTAVILTGGGHFAAAIYSGNVVLQVRLNLPITDPSHSKESVICQ